jgi:peroxiredoxin
MHNIEQEFQEGVPMSLREKFEGVTQDTSARDRKGNAAVATELLKMIGEEEKTRPLKVGDKAPDFLLKEANGNSLSSKEASSTGPLVLTFYRGLWCRYCQADLNKINTLLPILSEMSVSAAAITHSPEPGAPPAATVDLKLAFPILEDHDGETAVAYGVRWSREDLTLIEETNGLNVGILRGTEPWIVPMQARFLIGRDQKILFSEVAFSYDQCTDPDDLISLIQAI